MRRLSLLILSIILSVSTAFSQKQKAKIDAIELYLFNIEKPLHFSFGTWHNRQHVFVRVVSGKHSGWSEHNAGNNNLDFDLQKYGQEIENLKGMEPNEALKTVQSKYGDWNWGKLEVMELALYDLIGKMENKQSN